MPVYTNFKPFIDKPLWMPEVSTPNAQAAGGSLAFGLRNNATGMRNIYQLVSNTVLNVYNPILTDWLPLPSPALAGTFGAGATAIFDPSQGARSKLLAGSTNITLNLDGFGNGAPAAATWTRATTTATVTTTANHNFQTGQILTVTVSSDTSAIVLGNVTITVTAANQFTFTCLNAGGVSGTLTIGISLGVGVLGNRGDGNGFVIRVIDNGAGGTGLTAEMSINTNTAGATPVVTLNNPLPFTPVAGSSFEVLSGRVFLLGAGVAATGIFKYFDIASTTFSGNLAFANLPATIATDSCGVAFSELYVSNDRVPSSGQVSGGATYDTNNVINCIQATASTATSVTGSGMPALFADEYRNFQVRIVEDTINPTAVGQRRLITTHTSGSSAVFTVSAFAITPSSSAKFVIENFDDYIVLSTSATASVYTYSISANAWSTTTFGASTAVVGAGTCLALNFGITRDATGNSRQSFVYRIHGGATNTISVLDIAASTNGTWSNAITYANQNQTFTTGTCAVLDPVLAGGRYLYINVNATQRTVRFDLLDRVLDPCYYLRYPQGAAVAGSRMAISYYIDGSTKIGALLQLTASQTRMFSVILQPSFGG